MTHPDRTLECWSFPRGLKTTVANFSHGVDVYTWRAHEHLGNIVIETLDDGKFQAWYAVNGDDGKPKQQALGCSLDCYYTVVNMACLLLYGHRSDYFEHHLIR